MPDDQRPRVTRAGMNELGRPGLKHFSGNIYEEFLPQLSGDRAIRVYTEMRDNSPVIGAMLFAVESLLRSVDWYVEPADDSPPSVEAADFVEECMQDMEHTWEDFISEVLSMLVFGWSYHEIVYKQREGEKKDPTRTSRFNDGRIGWAKFGFRAQDTLFRWEIDERGRVLGMHQYPTPSTPFGPQQASIVFIPMDKALLFRTTSMKNNPEGRSILRNAYLPWYASKRAESIELIGMERDLAGMPIAKVPIEILSQDRTAEEEATYNYVKDIVTRTKRDQQEGIIWPLVYDESGKPLYEFELMSATGKRSFDTGAIIQRYQQQIVMTALADFILLGHENVGSFALSSDKTELFAVAMGQWLDNIAETLNRKAVHDLLRLNGFDTVNPPRIEHGDIEDPDLQILGGYVQSLSGAGAPIFPDIELENHLRDAAGLPPVDEEERERAMAEQATGGLLPGQPGGEIGPGPGPGAAPPPGPGRRPTVQGVSEDEGDEVAKARIQPRYYDGSRWKSVQSRHRFKRRSLRR